MRTVSFSALAALVVSSAISCSTPSAAGSWNQVYGNSRNSSYAGIVTQQARVPTWTRVLWKQLRVHPNAPVVGRDGRIFVSGSPNSHNGSGRLVCVDPSGNSTIFDISTEGPTSIPAIADDGRVYVVIERLTEPTFAPKLHCFDAQGGFKWKKELAHFGPLELGLVASDPKIHGDEVFVVTNSRAAPRLHAFDLDGNPIDSVGLPGRPLEEVGRGGVDPPAISDKLPHGSPGVVVAFDDALFAAGWVAGHGAIANPMIIQRAPGTYLGPPVISSAGEIVVQTDAGFEVYDTLLGAPSSACSLPVVTQQSTGQSIALFNDQPNQLYFGGATGMFLVVACTVQSQALAEYAPTPTVTKSFVYASARDGLHSLSPGLPAASHATAHDFHRFSMQPAVGPQGTIYEVAWQYAGQTDVVQLRAFDGKSVDPSPRPEG